MKKFYIINNGMKDLRGHYFETAVSVAEAARDLGWHPVLAGHITCEPGLIPSWIDFYPAFRTDHWMSKCFGEVENHGVFIDLSRMQKSPIEKVLSGSVEFSEYVASRFQIHPVLFQFRDRVEKKDIITTFLKRVARKYRELGLAKFALRGGKKLARESFPPFFWKAAKGIFHRFFSRPGMQPENQCPHPDKEIYLANAFGQDLSQLLAFTKATEEDFVFLPTAHGRELYAINSLIGNGAKLPQFGLEFRHALEFPIIKLPKGMEHDYVKQHRFFFQMVANQGLKGQVSLFTDSEELATDYCKFSRLPFSVLPIPFRQDFLAGHETHFPAKDEKLRLTYVGDPREEKGFHWLPYLVEHLREKYLEKGKAVLEIQASVHPSSEPCCNGALKILQSYPKEWVQLHGLEGPLSPEDYYKLVANSNVILCPYDQATYRARSSGTLTEAIAAGIPTIVPACSWLSSRQPPGTGLAFTNRESFCSQTSKLLDHYEEFLVNAKEAKSNWLKKHDPKELVLQATGGMIPGRESRSSAA